MKTAGKKRKMAHKRSTKKSATTLARIMPCKDLVAKKHPQELASARRPACREWRVALAALTSRGPFPNLGVLHRFSESPAMFERCMVAWRKFEHHLRVMGGTFDVRSSLESDRTLAEHIDKLFLDGADLSEGQYALAAAMSSRRPSARMGASPYP